MINIFSARERKFETRVIRLDNGFPHFTRQVAIPSGEIYVIGGVIKAKNKVL